MCVIRRYIKCYSFPSYTDSALDRLLFPSRQQHSTVRCISSSAARISSSTRLMAPALPCPFMRNTQPEPTCDVFVPNSDSGSDSDSAELRVCHSAAITHPFEHRHPCSYLHLDIYELDVCLLRWGESGSIRVRHVCFGMSASALRMSGKMSWCYAASGICEGLCMLSRSGSCLPGFQQRLEQ